MTLPSQDMVEQPFVKQGIIPETEKLDTDSHKLRHKSVDSLRWRETRFDFSKRIELCLNLCMRFCIT